ncbi:MAG: hypothetical protein BGN83_13400 [Rhizobium sp. 63-7]|nr:MAG: hypothetical protein BGN83_13400 [Rhizobium sp. 63-7]
MSGLLGREAKLRHLLRDKGGNFAITTALIIPVLLGFVGLAIDTSNLLQEKNRLQDAADSAALAAASALAEKGITENEARQLAIQFLTGQMANEGSTPDSDKGVPKDSPFTTDPVVEITETPVGGAGKNFKVEIKAAYTVPFSGFSNVVGFKSMDVSVKSVSESQTESKNALSMYLVLDKSGSMAWKTDTESKTATSCPNYTESNWKYYPNLAASSPCYISKINALKTAVGSLMTQLTTADPKGDYVRIGAISYDLDTQAATSLSWDKAATSTYVDALQALGGTASAKGMQTAYDSLMKVKKSGGYKEEDEHKSKNGQVPTKYIVFMTDGDNNYTGDDVSTKATCDAARTAKIQIYTVAFMAPTRGQQLLQYCATDTSHYFAADNMAELVAAFKSIGEKASQLSTRLTN